MYSAATNLPYNRVYKAIATMTAVIIVITHIQSSEMDNSAEKSKKTVATD